MTCLRHTILLGIGFQVLVSAQSNFVPSDLSQLSAVRESHLSSFSVCNTFIQTCQPTIASCASFICASCTDLGQSYINSCCASGPAPTACFLSVKETGGGNQYPKTESPPPIPSTIAPYGPISNSGFDACQSTADLSAVCKSLTSGFAQITIFEEQAPCLCYQGCSWAPQIYDGYVSQCQAYLVGTAALATLNTAPCRGVGNVLAGLSTYDSLHGLTAPSCPSTTASPITSQPSTSVTVLSSSPNAVVFVNAPKRVIVMFTLTVVILVIN